MTISWFLSYNAKYCNCGGGGFQKVFFYVLPRKWLVENDSQFGLAHIFSKEITPPTTSSVRILLFTSMKSKLSWLSLFLLQCLWQYHYLDWVVVSNIFYFHPYLGRWSNLTNIFQMGWNHQLVELSLYFGMLPPPLATGEHNEKTKPFLSPSSPPMVKGSAF